MKKINFDDNFMVYVKGGIIKAELPVEVEDSNLRDINNLKVMKYLVTQKLWFEIMKEKKISFEDLKENPIENISWLEALKFCNLLSEREGFQEVYDFGKLEQGIIEINQLSSKQKLGFEQPLAFKDTEGYRLPTSYEWQWFSMGGIFREQKGSLLANLKKEGKLNEIAWYKDNSNETTHKVGQKTPNELGIFDCLGNVEEWCFNDVNEVIYYEKPEYKNTINGRKNVMGGSFLSEEHDLIFINKGIGVPAEKKCPTIGFRIVRTIKD